MRKSNDWKRRNGIVYSTNPEFGYDEGSSPEKVTKPAADQRLAVLLDKHARAGKIVTVVSGHEGTDKSRAALAKELKTLCGVGGSDKDGMILLQGDVREKVARALHNMGFKVAVR